MGDSFLRATGETNIVEDLRDYCALLPIKWNYHKNKNMRLPALISFAGFVIIIVATFCPVLRLFYVLNWNVYDGNMPYGIIMLLIAMVGMLGTILNQQKLTRLMAYISLSLVVLFYLLTLLKLYTSFGFIKIDTSGVRVNTGHSVFHSIDKFLLNKIKFKWGIYVLFIGGVLAVAGTFLNKDVSNFKTD